LNQAAIIDFTKYYLLQNKDISNVVSLSNLSGETLPSTVKELLVNGYYPKRSGDLQIIFRPAVLEDFPKGTTHGTNWEYDRHIPLVFYGWHIKAKEDASEVFMTDIAATLATLLHIQMPNACIGKPILGITQK
jgi:hypothetical protein